MSESEHYPRLSPFRAGLACKCPVCGLDLQRALSSDGPAMTGETP